MRCPSCGQDADPANAFCPYCRTSLQLPGAPSSPYAGGSPSYGGPEYTQPQPKPADTTTGTTTTTTTTTTTPKKPAIIPSRP